MFDTKLLILLLGTLLTYQIDGALGNMPNCQDGFLYPADNPNGFFSCQDGELSYWRCPVEYYFDRRIKQCIPESCENGKFYPYTRYGYLYCDNGSMISGKCSVGLVFDSTLKACVKETNCLSGKNYPADTTNGFFFCIDGELTYERCPQGYYYAWSANRCAKEGACIEGTTYPGQLDNSLKVCFDGILV